MSPNSKKKTYWGLVLPVVLLLANISCLQAQSGVDIGARVIKRVWEPYKIAVGDFKMVGDSLSGADSLAQLVRQVVADDLDFHIFFDTVSVNQFYLDVWEITEITPVVWYRMGAEYLIEGEVEVDGNNLRVEYRIEELFTTGATNQLDRGRLKTGKQNYRRLAHMIADEAVRHIAAEAPFFTTRIAFISAVTGHKELYICDYDGANIVRLTADESHNLSPCWDQREDKILFTSYRRGKQQIWEHNIKTAKSRLISNYPVSNNAAAVSPDNQEIILSLSKDGNAELYVIDRDGKLKRRLTRIPSIEVGASWSPSGNMIAFQSDRSGSPQIYLMDAEGMNVQRLTFESKYNDSPDFSPRGDQIAFVSRGRNGAFQICTIDVNGENFTRLDQSGSNENPHWSPDGWHLVYCKRVGSQKDLCIMDRFGKRLKKITHDGKSSNPAWQPFTD